MQRQSGGLVLPVAGMAVIVLMAWLLVYKSSPPSPGPVPSAPPSQKAVPAPQTTHKHLVPGKTASPESREGTGTTGAILLRDSAGQAVGWRTLYRDNWEFLCPVMGHHILDPEEACRLIAAPARLGPIVVRDSSVRYDKPFTVKRNPSVPLVKYSIKHPVMSLPEYVGPRFYSERMMCANAPGKWIPSHRPVVDPQGRLIRYDPEQVRIFCGGGK